VLGRIQDSHSQHFIRVYSRDSREKSLALL
jgi:hypothetical protein